MVQFDWTPGLELGAEFLDRIKRLGLCGAGGISVNQPPVNFVVLDYQVPWGPKWQLHWTVMAVR